jgi:hypothetical protein
MDSIPASSATVESDEAVLNTVHRNKKIQKNPPFNYQTTGVTVLFVQNVGLCVLSPKVIG